MNVSQFERCGEGVTINIQKVSKIKFMIMIFFSCNKKKKGKKLLSLFTSLQVGHRFSNLLFFFFFVKALLLTDIHTHTLHILARV